MKRLLYLCAALMLTLGTLNAHAATDITGKWTGELKGPDGGTGISLTFTFKQDGATLTGAVDGGQGEPIVINDGKVDGNKISFTVSFNGMIIRHEGTFTASADGDVIKLNSKTDGGGGFSGGEMTLTRAPAPAKP